MLSLLRLRIKRSMICFKLLKKISSIWRKNKIYLKIDWKIDRYCNEIGKRERRERSYKSRRRMRKSGDFGFMEMNLEGNSPFPNILLCFSAHSFYIHLFTSSSPERTYALPLARSFTPDTRFWGFQLIMTSPFF